MVPIDLLGDWDFRNEHYQSDESMKIDNVI